MLNNFLHFFSAAPSFSDCSSIRLEMWDALEISPTSSLFSVRWPRAAWWDSREGKRNFCVSQFSDGISTMIHSCEFTARGRQSRVCFQNIYKVSAENWPDWELRYICIGSEEVAVRWLSIELKPHVISQWIFNENFSSTSSWACHSTRRCLLWLHATTSESNLFSHFAISLRHLGGLAGKQKRESNDIIKSSKRA